MTELYELTKQAEPEDFLQSVQLGQMIKNETLSEMTAYTVLRLTRYKDWKIIPAEPKVLAFEKIVDSINSEHVRIERSDFLTYQAAVELVKRGHKNGRLERDLELRPLVEAFKSPCVNLDDWARRINHELENLKPLKPETEKPAPYCGLCQKKCKNRIHDGKACRGFEEVAK